MVSVAVATANMADPHAGLTSLLDDLEMHSVYNNQYFRFLEETKWTPETYALHRANFFCRTEMTVKGIAHLCARAAEVSDRFTLNLFAYILNEEAGNGNVDHNHEEFMEGAHNYFGSAEYGLDPLIVKEAKDSPLVLNETFAYRTRLRELITGSYQCMLGVAMALESHADIMLQQFRSAFRLNRQQLGQSEYESKVEIYFNSHVGNGVEERHAADARRCVFNNCRNHSDLREIAYGANETLKAQLNMWTALYGRAVELGGTSGNGRPA